jgi:dTMP kinase
MKKKFFENKFIVIEGIDFSGKTTQIKMLSDFLSSNGIKVHCTKEPGGTEFGERVRELLLSENFKNLHPMSRLLSFLAIRIEHYEKILIPKMQDGYTILCDRFDLSTYAYLAGRFDLEQVAKIDEASVGYFCKFSNDLQQFKSNVKFIFLDISDNEFKRRYTKRLTQELNHYDRFAFKEFSSLRKSYNELCEKLGYYKINANGNEISVHKKILSFLRQDNQVFE